MPSPFPGVDPYLESQGYWPDFHSRFVNYWCEAISDALPGTYEARIEEQVQILELDTNKSRIIRPDVSVTRPPEVQRTASQKHVQGSVATLEAVTLPFPLMEEVRERWIQILHRPERSLVAVLELLSPTNKTNPGRGQYLAKRSDLFVQEVHLVEVDLLLAGERLPMGKPLPPGDHYAFVARSDQRPKADVYAWSLQDPLPTVPIPLLKPDSDIFVDLKAVFATAYERGRYDRSVDYSATIELPLSEGNRRWAEETRKNKT